MLDKLAALEERFELIAGKISDPEVIADQEAWRKYCKEHSDLTPIVEKYRELKAAQKTVEDDREMLESPQDKEFEEMIRDELTEAQSAIERVTDELKILLLPKDPNDDKNVIMEIRGGTGGRVRQERFRDARLHAERTPFRSCIHRRVFARRTRRDVFSYEDDV